VKPRNVKVSGLPNPLRARRAAAWRPNSTFPQMRGDRWPEVVHPAAHGFVRDRDPALGEQILDVAKS
jgi:hypothetical protein